MVRTPFFVVGGDRRRNETINARKIPDYFTKKREVTLTENIFLGGMIKKTHATYIVINEGL
jgi:hypothetical protein